MENINIASFSEANTATVKGIWQYDFGQILRIEGLGLPDAVEVHFSLQKTGGEAKRRIGVTKDGVTDVRIPDFILEEESSVKYEAYAFIYVSDRIHGNTTKKIIMEIEARPKPEAFNKPCEAEIFQDTIEAVRESMAGAEAAAELAEAWAHGHEDHPENAEDNAKHYSDLASASKEATENLKSEVENMKSSVDQSKSNVAENLKAAESAKKAAQESATNASTSEKNAKASETASATSAKNASTSEANAKKSADGAATSKAAVDQTVQEFNQTATNALNDVNTAGKAQKDAVTKAGTDALTAISAAKTESVNAVENAGTAQTDKVNKAGTTQTDAVNAAGKKQVGDIDSAGSTKVNEVNSAGAAAVKAVEGTGKEQTANATKAGTDAVNSINKAGSAQITAIQEEGEKQKKAIENYANEVVDFREQVLANTAALGGFSFVCNPDDGGLDIVYTVSE